MKNSILSKKNASQADLSLEDYQKLKEGLKKKLISRSSLYTIGKGCFVLGLPLLAVNTGQAQCQTFSITNSVIPDDGGFANGLGVDMDGDGNADLIFYESPNGDGKVRRVAGGSMSIVTTGGAYAFRSAVNFANGAAIPGGNGADYRAYWDYPGGGNWPVENGGGSATGFMGIKIGPDYGFLEFTVNRTGSSYFATFPSGGAPEATTGNSTAGDCNSILPVDFMSFITRTQGNDVTLIWKTSSETNNAGFQLQRSEDGRNFVDIHWEEGQGNTQSTTTYEYTDEDLTSGKTYYYRLNQIDFDGRSDFSPVISVNIKGDVTEFGDFYPNPVENAQSVAINASTFKSSEWTGTIYDPQGILVDSQVFQLEEGRNNLDLNIEKLAAGTYFVKFEGGNERFYKTLIVQ